MLPVLRHHRTSGTFRVQPRDGGIWQFVYCAACGAYGDGDPMDANGARNLWNRGPIQIRAEVA